MFLPTISRRLILVRENGRSVTGYGPKSLLTRTKICAHGQGTRKGTTFRLFLPGATEDVATVEPSLPAQLVRGRGETILVVEDNPALRRVIVRQLMELGYRVREAENARVALRLTERESIDLLLTDISCPVAPTGTSWPGRLVNAG